MRGGSDGWARRADTGKSIFVDDIADPSAFPPGSFLCLDPRCQTPVFPKKRGTKRKHHFCHYGKGDGMRCGGGWSEGESAEHMAAKHFLARNVSRCCFLDYRCGKCGRRHGVQGTWSLAADVEHRVHTPGGVRVADVMLLGAGGAPLYAVEVRHTHAVGNEKAQDLLGIGVRVLEVEAAEVLARRDAMEGVEAAEGSLAYQIRLVGYRRDLTCDDCAMGEAARAELRAWRAHERRYAVTIWRWFEHREAVARRAEDEARHRGFQRAGVAAAKRSIERAKRNRLFWAPSPYRRGDSYKCVGCGRWRARSGDEGGGRRRAAIRYGGFCRIEDFRNKYACKATFNSREHARLCYETWEGTACGFCAMACPKCGGDSTAQMLSEHGCCYGCNLAFHLAGQAPILVPELIFSI